jgi:Ca-activated chloride channel homolog
MSFLAPAMFALSALLPIIVLMYLLKLRRMERTVSSTFLWRQMTHDLQANAPWQRLRRNLLLLLQLLFLAALILALARPATRQPGVSSASTILIIDVSASMAATDSAPTRLEAAKGEARRLVEELPSAAQATVIAAGPKARVLISQTTDRRLALQAIEGLQVTPGGADLAVALQLASAIARRQPDTQTFVLSDGNADLPARLAVQGRLTYRQIGRTGENQAIGLLNLENTPGQGVTAFAQVINYSPEAVQRRLAFYADGQMFDAFDVSLPANGQQSVLAQGILSTTQVVEARLLPVSEGQIDYLPLDDQALAVNRPSEPVSVTLLSAGNLFLETGLGLLPTLRVTRYNPGTETSLPAAGLTILDSYIPLTVTLPAGSLLFIAPVRSTEYFSVTGMLTAPRPTPAAVDQPLLQYVSLDGINILDSARIPLPPWATPVIITQDETGAVHPLLFAGEVAGRRIAVLTFDLRRSDLPLNVAFPILLANLTKWLAPGGSSLPTQVSPGQALSLALPPSALISGATQVRVSLPDGAQQTLDAQNGPAVFGDTGQLGLYQVDLGGPAPEQFAVNLFNAQESRLQPAAELPITGSENNANAGADSQAYREWWRLLAALALGLLTAEWLIYHRATVVRLATSWRPK